MLRVPIRSRSGALVLGFLGVVYLVSSVAILIYYLVTSWGAMTLMDNVMQMGLIASGIGGFFFILIAQQNLKPSRAPEKSRSARDHQTAAATGS